VVISILAFRVHAVRILYYYYPSCRMPSVGCMSLYTNNLLPSKRLDLQRLCGKSIRSSGGIRRRYTDAIRASTIVPMAHRSRLPTYLRTRASLASIRTSSSPPCHAMPYPTPPQAISLRSTPRLGGAKL